MQFFVFAFAVLATSVFAQETSSAATPTKTADSYVHHIEHEHVVDFRKPCECPPAQCHPFLNAKSMCECEAAAQVACYKSSHGGCPSPLPAVC